LALIGYSFGADVIPFAYNRLPASDHVVLIALLGLSKSADFEISVRGWLGEPPGPDALPVLPQATKIPPQLIQCFYGQRETDTACPQLAQLGAETFRRNGAHHYDGNYRALADAILAGFKKRATARHRSQTVPATDQMPLIRSCRGERQAVTPD
jgi:type IV secretory pathway VirJ component